MIAHARCAPNAPATCILRAQLLEIANSPPAMDSPDPMDIIRQFTPSASPVPDPVFQSPTPDVAPPTAFRMFGAFRRSRSSLSPTTTDTDAKAGKRLSVSQTSHDGSSESVLTQGHTAGSPNLRPQRPNVRVKNRPRPLSTSGDNLTTPTNRGSQRSAETNGDSIDLSDDSYSQAHSNIHSGLGHSIHNHSNSTSYTYSRSQVALPSPSQVLSQSLNSIPNSGPRTGGGGGGVPRSTSSSYPSSSTTELRSAPGALGGKKIKNRVGEGPEGSEGSEGSEVESYVR